MGPHKRLIKAPVAERGPEEIGIVVSVPSLQRKWGRFTVGRLLVHPLRHDGVEETERSRSREFFTASGKDGSDAACCGRAGALRYIK